MSTSDLPTLQPRSIGQLLDQAFRLYRRNFFRFIGIIAIVQIPISIIQTVISTMTTNNFTQAALGTSSPEDFLGPAYWGNLALVVISPIFTFIVIQGVGTAALTRAIADSFFGEKVGILDAYKRLGPSWYRLIIVFFLLFIFSIGAFIWLLVPCVGWLTGPGILMFISLAIFPLLAPIVVLEGKTGGGAIRRAWDLARRRFWWLIGFVFLLYLLGQILITGPAALAGVATGLLIGEGLVGAASLSLIRSIFQGLISLFASLLFLPIQLSAITLLYFDLRIRSEGLDLALQADAASESPSGYAAMIAQTPAAADESLITTQEAGYFVGLSLGAVFIYALIVGIIFVLFSLVLAASGAAGF